MWARFAGALIDGALHLLCWLPTSLPFGRAIREQFASGQFSIPGLLSTYNELLAKSLPYLFVLVAVQACLLSLRGQSIGKLLMRTQIVRTKTGLKAGFLHAYLLRGFLPWMVEQIPLLGQMFWLANISFIFGAERHCLHDRIADTKVVKI